MTSKGTAARQQAARGARPRLARASPGSFSAAWTPVGSPASYDPCDTSARDRTSLPNCVKTYLPAPTARGAPSRDPAGQLYLALLAFGRRHPDQPWQLSVYQIADRRLQHS